MMKSVVTTRTVIRSRVKESEKIRDGWLWRDMATKQRHWFPHDRLKASHDDACHVCVSPKTIASGMSLHAAPGLTIRLREGLGKLTPTASRNGASFGCQQRRVARRHLEKVSRLGTIAYRTRLRDRLVVDEKPKQHAIFRHAHSTRFHVFDPRPVD